MINNNNNSCIKFLIISFLIITYNSSAEERIDDNLIIEAETLENLLDRKLKASGNLVAILFIIFDLEITFLFPWAVVIDQIGMFGFISMLVFLAILVVGFIYEWKKGALDWE